MYGYFSGILPIHINRAFFGGCSHFMTLVFVWKLHYHLHLLDDLQPTTGPESHPEKPISQGCWRLIGRRVRIQDISAEGCSRNDQKNGKKTGHRFGLHATTIVTKTAW